SCFAGPDACACGVVQSANRLEPRDSRSTDVFQILLPRKHHELLHVLLDEQISAHDPERAVASVPVSGGGGGGNVYRRAGGRSRGPQTGHLVVDSWRTAVHVDSALLKSLVDQHFERGH